MRCTGPFIFPQKSWQVFCTCWTGSTWKAQLNKQALIIANYSLQDGISEWVFTNVQEVCAIICYCYWKQSVEESIKWRAGHCKCKMIYVLVCTQAVVQANHQQYWRLPSQATAAPLISRHFLSHLSLLWYIFYNDIKTNIDIHVSVYTHTLSSKLIPCRFSAPTIPPSTCFRSPFPYETSQATAAFANDKASLLLPFTPVTKSCRLSLQVQGWDVEHIVYMFLVDIVLPVPRENRVRHTWQPQSVHTRNKERREDEWYSHDDPDNLPFSIDWSSIQSLSESNSFTDSLRTITCSWLMDIWGRGVAEEWWCLIHVMGRQIDTTDENCS